MLKKREVNSMCGGQNVVSMEEALGAVEDTKINGREIWNSINTVRTLAKSEGSKLKLVYLQTIVQVWSEFEESFGSLQKVELADPNT